MKLVVMVASVAIAYAGAARAADGTRIFANTCKACHQAGGVGAPGLAPPLVSPLIADAAGKKSDYPALAVINGLTGAIPLAGGGMIASAMPPQKSLSDDEVAAVLGYVYRLNHAKAGVRAADIARLRNRSIGSEELKRLRAELMP